MIAGVVGANNAVAGMWRAGSGTFQPSNDGEIGSADGGAGYLDRGSNLDKPLSHRFVREEAVSALTGAALQDEASLYDRGRQCSNFTVQARRCERAREALDGTASNSEDAIDNQKGKTGPESR